MFGTPNVINLRYHIVSIVAVFLAVRIGLALGSTFVDSVLVSELEDQVDKFEADTLAAVAERDAAVGLAKLEPAPCDEISVPVRACHGNVVLATSIRGDELAARAVGPGAVEK